MIRVITTTGGQLLAEHKDDHTIIRNSEYKVMARVESIDKKEVDAAIRKIGTLMKMKQSLELVGVQVYPEAVLLIDAFARNGGSTEEMEEEVDESEEVEEAEEPVKRFVSPKIMAKQHKETKPAKAASLPVRHILRKKR
jgi:hypothetical protein